MLREWAAQEADADQYEIPDVQGSIPPCMRQTALDEGELAASRTRSTTHSQSNWWRLHLISSACPPKRSGPSLMMTSASSSPTAIRPCPVSSPCLLKPTLLRHALMRTPKECWR